MEPSFLREKFNRQARANKVKLGLMVALLLAVIYGMVELTRSTGQATGKKPKASLEQRSETEDVLGEPRGTGTGGPEASMQLSEQELQQWQTFLDDPSALDQVEDKRVDLQDFMVPFFHLLHRVHEEDTHQELKAQAQDVGWAKLWEKPQDYRARPIRVHGEIVDSWRQPLGPNPMGLEELWAYRVRAAGAPEESQGHLYDVYAIEKLVGALPRDRVTTFGRFFMARIDEPEGIEFAQAPDLHVAVVVARRFEPLDYLGEPELPGPVVKHNTPEARPLFWLLHRAQQTSLDQLREEALEGVSFVDLSTRPGHYRGQPIALRGELRHIERIQLPENPMRLEHCYYGQILDSDRRMNTFYCLRIPQGLHEQDPVVLYGTFLKIWSYKSQRQRYVPSPVFVGKALLVRTIERSYWAEIALGAVLGLTAIALLLAHLRERRRQLAAAEARRQRQLRRAPKNLGEVARQRAAPGPRGEEGTRDQGQETSEK
ncbi:MAG: hypothetical protein ACLF0G_13575 [Candidatus Brocadiia bacterium]